MKGKVYYPGDFERIEKMFAVDDSTPVMRYMDFSKYISLLETKRLFFCEAKIFEDSSEGAIPKSYLNFWPEEERPQVEKIGAAVDNTISTYINCWSEGIKESYAMWKIYTVPQTGVCICSTVGHLKKALNSSEIRLYRVKYIDLKADDGQDIEIPIVFCNSSQGKFPKEINHVYKNKEYEYENEVRAIFVSEAREKGIEIEVDIDQLIQKVLISPYSQKWFDELVRKMTLRYIGTKKDFFRNSNINLRM